MHHKSPAPIAVTHAVSSGHSEVGATLWLDLSSLGWHLRDRSFRVSTLVVIAMLMGLIDLGVTLHYMATTGMCEANQIARTVAAGGPAALIVFKLASIATYSSIIMSCRRRWTAEIGAWVAVCIMTTVLLAWLVYIRAVDDPVLIASTCSDAWVRF